MSEYVAYCYAKAVIEHAKENQNIDDWHNFLSVCSLISTKSICSYCRSLSFEEAYKFLIDMFPCELSNAQKRFLKMIIEWNRLEILSLIEKKYESILEESKGIMPAFVYHPHRLTKKDQASIEAYLKNLYPNYDFNIKYIEDKSLIGGLKVHVESKVIDASVKNSLRLLSNALQIQGD